MQLCIKVDHPDRALVENRLLQSAVPGAPNLFLTVLIFRNEGKLLIISRMQRYISTMLRSLSKSNGNFENYDIDRGTRSWIITLRIRKQHKPYRRSRTGLMHLHRIHTLNLQWPQNQNTQGISYANLSTLHITVPHLGKSIHLSHINAHSIQGRIGEFQQYVIQEKTDVCIITESWLKSSDKSDNLES